jgi:hypothetical protein
MVDSGEVGIKCLPTNMGLEVGFLATKVAGVDLGMHLWVVEDTLSLLNKSAM